MSNDFKSCTTFFKNQQSSYIPDDDNNSDKSNSSGENTINDKSKDQEQEQSSETEKFSFFKAVVLTGKLAVSISSMSLPQTFLQLSFGWGIIFIIFFGICNYWTFNLLAYVCDKHKIYDYSTLVRKLLGAKTEKIYNFVMWLSCLFCMIAYLNICKIIVFTFRLQHYRPRDLLFWLY